MSSQPSTSSWEPPNSAKRRQAFKWPRPIEVDTENEEVASINNDTVVKKPARKLTKTPVPLDEKEEQPMNTASENSLQENCSEKSDSPRPRRTLRLSTRRKSDLSIENAKPIKRRRPSTPGLSKEIFNRKGIDTDNDREWQIGSLVWAWWGNKWWSAIVVEKDTKEQLSTQNYWVFWFGDHRASLLPGNRLCDFQENYSLIMASHEQYSKRWRTCVKEAVKEFVGANSVTDSDLTQFILDEKFKSLRRENSVPFWVRHHYHAIHTNSDETGGDSEVKGGCSETLKQLIQTAIANQTPVKNVCLGCYKFTNDYEHPYFEGSICERCVGHVPNTEFTYEDDGFACYCTICSKQGNCVFCLKNGCGKAYCSTCLDNLAAPEAFNKIKKDEENSWSCFLCEDYRPDLNGVLHRRLDFAKRIRALLEQCKTLLVNMPRLKKKKIPIVVLSLYDGMSTGLYVLIKLKIKVGAYYVCEIDKNGISVSRKNFGVLPTYIGSIECITPEVIKRISPIHLVIGGSPCNDLSIVNPDRKGLYDQSGTGKYVFEYFRVLKLVSRFNPDGFYWLFENVASMTGKCRETLSKFFQSEPVLLNAIDVSPQQRPRLFWGNLPSMKLKLPKIKTHLQNYLSPGRTAAVDQVRTVTSKSNSLKQGKSATYPVRDVDGQHSVLSVTELEVSFGFPAHYTDTGFLLPTERLQLIGKSWSVPVIEHLLKFLQGLFSRNDGQ